MPARSKKQQMAAGAALAAKRGQRSKASLRGASRSMAKSMTKSELEELAETKRRRLPTRARKSAARKSATRKSTARKSTAKKRK
jgi:hypothetical protein